MTDSHSVVLKLSRLEAAHLAGLVTQFAELLADTDSVADDPAVARLVPDAYADDPEAAQEFRDLTQHDLLNRRSEDAALVLHSLGDAVALLAGSAPDDALLREDIELRLEPDEVRAWLRCLAAVRLVLAERLGIHDESDHDESDPRFGVYDWLGYRLDGLVRAMDR